MSTLNYMQYGLANQLDLELTGEEPIVFNVILKAEEGRIVLEYDQPAAPGQDYIAITCDSVVDITLVGDQLWFSKEFDAITTKEPLSSFYGGLEYSAYDEKLDRYKAVRFNARFNQGGKYGTRHRFNINVDLLQDVNACEPRWIGLTIDPDIKNPPPQV
ncbi:nucleotide synthetase [Novosphingobium aerophilum]|uniref:nucleotide synthetase n=1 Tax=Novosphingobium TaxID=165696 RepID=UPI0012D1C627|nr:MULTISPECIES: nucleotide synthetase [unclassified Novosphingobium]MPS68402.1 hypothetical protein [Novosphingobium sp.]WRT95555.1 nucleotide synthetase [Novosphingobium sp. RL4]